MADHLAGKVHHGRTALVAGASGLVGTALLAALLADPRYTAVLSIGRRTLDLAHPKLKQQVVDFRAISELAPVDDAFIALGTTIKVAGSQSAMRALDVDAVVAVAQAAKAAGAKRLGVVSSMGANAKSPVFYTRIKGEMEAAVQSLNFVQTVIAQPGQLSGPREALGQPHRASERAALAVMHWLKPLIPANYRPIPSTRVASALIAAMALDSPGIYRLLSGDMQRTN